MALFRSFIKVINSGLIYVLIRSLCRNEKVIEECEYIFESRSFIWFTIPAEEHHLVNRIWTFEICWLRQSVSFLYLFNHLAILHTRVRNLAFKTKEIDKLEFDLKNKKIICLPYVINSYKKTP